MIAALFLQRVAFSYCVTWASFASVKAEIALFLVQLALTAATTLYGDVHLKDMEIVYGIGVYFVHLVLIVLRLHGECRGGLTVSTECRTGWALNVMQIASYGELAIACAMAGCWGASVVSLYLCIPCVTLPRAETFFLKRNGFFYGTTWPYIYAAILWRLGFDAARHHSVELFLARTAANLSDLLIACAFHPAKWLHARVLSESLTFTYLYVLNRHVLLLPRDFRVDLEGTWLLHVLDLAPNGLAFLCLTWHVYASFWGSRPQRAALLRPLAASLYADKYDKFPQQRQQQCLDGGQAGAQEASEAASGASAQSGAERAPSAGSGRGGVLGGDGGGGGGGGTAVGEP